MKKLYARWQRFRWQWLIRRDSAKELNRRVEVEERLLDAAAGKVPLPDAKECRRLANKLGVPDWASKKGKL